MKSIYTLLAAAAILIGCSTPKNTYYTLSTPDIPAATSLTHKTRIMVGPVTVPSLVDTPQLVVRNSNNHVTVYEYQRWAGSLKTDIERVVAADLVRDLSTPNVWSYTQSPFAQYDYQVLMDVQSIDSKLADSVSLDVLWTVKAVAKKAGSATHAENHDKNGAKSSGHVATSHPSITGRSVVREPVSGAGFEPLIAAQSRAFDQVSNDIAKAIRQN